MRNQTEPPFPLSNPFDASRVRPGAIPFLGAESRIAEAFERLAERPGVWQILGPHGAGKSTLAEHLVRLWRDRGGDALRCDTNAWRTPAPGGLWIVDGAEQTTPLGRAGFKLLAWSRRVRLVWVAHEDLGPPVLWRFAPDADDLQRVVDHLTRNWSGHIGSDIVGEAFAQSRGNLREALFHLYDHVESISASGANPAGDANVTD